MNRHGTQLMAMAAAGMFAMCGTAFAQAQGGGGGGGDFDQPLTNRRAAGRSAVAQQPSTRLMMMQTDGQTRYELQIEDGEVTAKVDGREVPQERIRRDGDKVEILNRRGEVLTTFHVGGVSRGGGGGVVGGAPRAAGPRALVAPAPRSAPAAPAGPPPKVMLGITMAEPSDSLLEQTDLEEGKAVLVANVIKGLPADKAGLKVNDLIVKIDGMDVESRDTVRQVLREKEPGDTVDLFIRRKGESKRLKVKLAEYDQEALSAAGPTTVFRAEGVPEVYEDANRMLREHMQKWRAEGIELPPPMVYGPRGEGDMQFYIPSLRSPAETAKLEARMKELEVRLEKLSEQIEKMQRQLERSR